MNPRVVTLEYKMKSVSIILVRCKGYAINQEMSLKSNLFFSFHVISLLNLKE